MKIVAIIQAHSKDWEGRKDICLKELNNHYVIEEVIKKVKKIDIIDEVIIAAPDVVENSIFNKIAEKNGIKCHLGSKDNVLKRIKDASEIVNGEIILRVMGQHIFIDTDLLKEMILFCRDNNYDFVQTPDDFWSRYAGEIITSRFLNKIEFEISDLGDNEKISLFQARPISFIKEQLNLFNAGIYNKIPIYTEKQHRINREIFSRICNPAYTDVSVGEEESIGNVSTYRYQFVKQFISPDDVVLDIACGTGYGSFLLSNIAKLVIGGDISLEPIKKAKKKYISNDLIFQLQDATELSFPLNTFDKIISIETIEHVPLRKINQYCSEMRRVIKPGGLFICSTPQNNQGNIPIQPAHEKEYNLNEFKEILGKYFKVLKVYGLRGGVYSEKEEGEGMLAVCKKN